MVVYRLIPRALSLDLDVDAGCDGEYFQLVDGIKGRVEEVEYADVGAHFELLSRLSVDVRGSKNCIDLPFRRQWDGSDYSGPCSLRRFDNILYRSVEHPLVECFKANAYFLSRCF